MQSKSRDSVPEPQTFKLKGSASASQLAKSREQVPTRQATKNREPVSVPQGSKLREQVPVLQASKPRTASALEKPRTLPGGEPVLQTSKPRAPVLHTPKSKEPVLESLVPKPREVPHAPKAVPKANGFSGLPKPQGAWKSETGLVPSSSVARPSVSKGTMMKGKIEPCARTQVPKEKEVFQKPLPVMKPKLRDVKVSPAINRDFIQHPVQPVKPKVRDVKAEPVPASKSASAVQQSRIGDGSSLVLKEDRRPVVSGMPPVATDEPCFSGRTSDAGEKRESKHHRQHHSSKKSKRKESDKLFEKLITNWKPPVVDQFQEDMGDLDWLMSGAKKRRVENERGEDDWLSKSSSKCKAGEGLLGHTKGMMPGSYQTGAVYMPELDMYQLPYVVPF